MCKQGDDTSRIGDIEAVTAKKTIRVNCFPISFVIPVHYETHDTHINTLGNCNNIEFAYISFPTYFLT